jgi:hypothetical protein
VIYLTTGGQLIAVQPLENSERKIILRKKLKRMEVVRKLRITNDNKTKIWLNLVEFEESNEKLTFILNINALLSNNFWWWLTFKLQLK